MNYYEIPQGAYYSIGKKLPPIKQEVYGFEFEFTLTPSAFYVAISTDIQKIGGITLDPLKQSIMRLGYRTMDHNKNPLPPGKGELHAYLSLNGKYDVAARRLGIIEQNVKYTGTVIFDSVNKKAIFTINQFATPKSYDFNAKQFSLFGVWGYHQYPFFEDRGKGASQDMEYWLEVRPLVRYLKTVSPSNNLMNLTRGILKLPVQAYAQTRSYLLGHYRRFRNLPI